MKRLLVLCLIVVIAAGYLGTLVARDPGYVLVTYGNYSLQTSLWVLIAAIVLVSIVLYLLVRSFSLVRRTGGMYAGWREQRKTDRAARLTEKGMRLLAEGEYERAIKFLEGGSDNNSARGLNYLAAARAANDLGQHESRETYLRQAEEADPDLARARAVVTAELALERDNAEAALAALQPVKPTNAHVEQLRHRAMLSQQGWKNKLAVAAELRRSDKSRARQLEEEAALEGLSAGLEDAELNTLYKSLSPAVRQTPPVIAEYVNALHYKAHAEPLLRSAIRKQWNPALVELYGESDFDTLRQRRKTAEGWLRKHGDDASLQYCLGRIYELSNEDNMAREAYVRSIDLGGPRKANEKLAMLLARSGDFERSNEQLQQALGSGS